MGWQAELRERLARGALADARALLEAGRAPPGEEAGWWLALAEVAAAQDDLAGCQRGVGEHIRAVEAATGEPCRELDPVWLVDDDVRLRLAQVWAARGDGNRRSFAALLEALKRFDWFVPPAAGPEEQDPDHWSGRLATLEAASASSAEEMSLWQSWVKPGDGDAFRGEFCVSQATAFDASNFGAAKLVRAYRLAQEYAALQDRVGALDATDDGAFGGFRFRISDRVTSRDLIDSCLELNFIIRHCGFATTDPIHLVDIGAGWGRLVHRFLRLFPSGRAHALDLIPFTSLCAERFLSHCGLLDRAVVGNRAALAGVKPGTIDIATNIHSWSEVPLASIERWLEAIEALRVPYLFFVAHSLPAVSLERSGSGHLIAPRILARGWDLVVEEPKYGASLQRQQQGLYPTAHYLLFRNRYGS